MSAADEEALEWVTCRGTRLASGEGYQRTDTCFGPSGEEPQPELSNGELWEQMEEMIQVFQSSLAAAHFSTEEVKDLVVWEDKKRQVQRELDHFQPVVLEREDELRIESKKRMRMSQRYEPMEEDGDRRVLVREAFLEGDEEEGYLRVEDFDDGTRVISENQVDTGCQSGKRRRVTQRKITGQTENTVTGSAWKEIVLETGAGPGDPSVAVLGEKLLNVEDILAGPSIAGMTVRHYETSNGREVWRGKKESRWTSDTGEQGRGKVRMEVIKKPKEPDQEFMKISQHVKEEYEIGEIQHRISTTLCRTQYRTDGGYYVQVLLESMNHELTRTTAIADKPEPSKSRKLESPLL
ncbi:unnamed protein product [Cyprideis torosa]|uniref:Uncharacterized protein n=1 Tax=Cyprideis torosa TaxID=163714 RepID=A0A7R8W4S7_9CRUS|nr:unnamed protein product [Cyprideis torosa]CAG0884525.1 unnamed protein product [Cyprideis torosa]